jgi:ABC-type uncharacterized transport system involved in gliding motility auxiliary subunit
MSSSKKFLTITSLITAAVLLLAVNVLSNTTFTSTRLDLTASKLFTLTAGTTNILAKLDEPITLRLFLSQREATRLPGINSYTQRVRELLEEYERIANGNIRLQIVDPEPFSEQEDRAVGYGLRGIGLEGDAVFYFGLVGTNSVDDQEVIPFFSPNREEFLEHDITKLVYQLTTPERKVVGIMSTLPIDGGMAMPGRGMAAPWAVLDQVRQLFEVRTVAIDATSIPADIDVLMLVHPKNLSEPTLYAIDQFILTRGRALIFVDPNSESDQPGAMPMLGGEPGGSDLPELFALWGIDLVDGKVAGDLRVAEQVRFTDNGRTAVAEYPVWMNLQPDQFNADDIITAELGNLVFATSGILESKNADEIKVEPLVETTPDAMQIDAGQLRFLGDPTVLLRQYRPEGKKLMLAARVSGGLKTAFPDGRPESKPDENQTDDTAKEDDDTKAKDVESAPHRAASVEDVNLVVVADTDLLNDRFWVRVQDFLGSRILIPSAANGNFVINALESLTGSNDLISVRSRGRFSRPFTKVADIQQHAELRYRQKEQELLTRLRETEDKLLELEDRKQGDEAIILNEAQQREIEKFRSEKIRIRKDLRTVRHQLHKDIEGLASWMKFVNIGLMPMLIGTGGIFIALQRARRRQISHDRKQPS